MGKNKGYKKPLKKNVTEIAAIIWLCTTLLTIQLFGVAIDHTIEHNAPAPVTAHNSAIDNVTDVINIDVKDNLKKNEDMFSNISHAPSYDLPKEVKQEVSEYKIGMRITCAYLLCGIAMFVAFRKTKWLQYVYFVFSSANLCVSYILFSGLLCR